MAAAIDSEKKFVTAPIRNHRRDQGLSPSEVQDLQLVFDGAESIFGVRSSQGALEDELARRCPSDAVRDQVSTENRARAVRRRRPKKTSFSPAFAPLYEACGMRAPIYREAEDDLPIWAKEYADGSDDHSYAGTGGDVDLDSAGRVSHARSRLILVGSNSVGVLYAAYGPRAAQWAKDGRGNPTHPATWFGSHLVEIAVAVLAFRNYEAGEKLDARAQVWSYAEGGEHALELRDTSRAYLEGATTAYRATRCARPCRRCWPI